MTDFTPTVFKDAWVNPSRTGLNTGSWERLSLRNTGERAFVRPALPAGLAGRTVLSAVLRAHVSGAWAAQTVVLTRVTSRWIEGRITSANQPTVTTTGQVSVTTGALADGDVIEWDVTAMMQLFADGTDYYGFRVTTDAATRQKLYSHQSGQPAWELEITVSDAPDVPSNLRPDGGSVSTALPVVAWDFVDLGGDSTEQAKSRVQVDTPATGAEPDEVAPDFDSGWMVNVDPQTDLLALALNEASNSDFSTDTSGWRAGANTTLGRSTTIFYTTPASGSLTATAAGDVFAWANGATGARRPVTPGETLYTEAYVRTPAAARTAQAGFQWFDAAGAAIGVAYGTAVATTTGAFTKATATAVVPAGAVTAEYGARANGLAAAEVAYLDSAFINRGTARLGPSSTLTNYWRVNVQDGDGNESGWSDWADYTDDAKPSIVMDSPTGVFGDPTPTIIAHLSTGTLSAWQVIITGPDRSDIRANSGRQTGPLEWTVPLRDTDGRRVIREGQTGWARIRMWDSVDRVTAVGDPTYAQEWVALNLDEDALLARPDNLTIIQASDGDPRHAWTWQRTEAAEAWLIEVDGHTVARLDPDDVTLNAGTYSWTDTGILPPLREHTAAVRAVDAGGKKSRRSAITRRHAIDGVWIVPIDGADAPVRLSGGDVSEWITTDAYATYKTVTGRQHDVFYGWSPRSGLFLGTIAGDRPDLWESLERLETYRLNHNRLFRLVWGSQATLVRLRDIDWTSSNDINPENLQHLVRFGFVEWGE